MPSNNLQSTKSGYSGVFKFFLFLLLVTVGFELMFKKSRDFKPNPKGQEMQ